MIIVWAALAGSYICSLRQSYVSAAGLAVAGVLCQAMPPELLALSCLTVLVLHSIWRLDGMRLFVFSLAGLESTILLLVIPKRRFYSLMHSLHSL